MERKKKRRAAHNERVGLIMLRANTILILLRARPITFPGIFFSCKYMFVCCDFFKSKVEEEGEVRLIHYVVSSRSGR